MIVIKLKLCPFLFTEFLEVPFETFWLMIYSASYKLNRVYMDMNIRGHLWSKLYYRQSVVYWTLCQEEQGLFTSKGLLITRFSVFQHHMFWRSSTAYETSPWTETFPVQMSMQNLDDAAQSHLQRQLMKRCCNFMSSFILFFNFFYWLQLNGWEQMKYNHIWKLW